MNNIARTELQYGSPYDRVLAACRSRNTRQTYSRCLNNIANLFGASAAEFDWNGLSLEQILDLHAKLPTLYGSPSTSNLHLSALKSLMFERLGLATLSGEMYQQIKRLPRYQQIRYPQMGRIITQEEFLKVLRTCEENVRGVRDNIILRLMYATGVRVQEVVAIRWEHYNSDEGSILIVGKDNKDRLIFLPATLKRSFDDWNRLTGNMGWVFRSYRGMLTRQALYKMLATRCRKAGVDPFLQQDFQYTYRSKL